MSARYYALHLHLCIRFGSSNEQVLVAIIPNIYKLIICTFLNISAAICPLYLLFINWLFLLSKDLETKSYEFILYNFK